MRNGVANHYESDPRLYAVGQRRYEQYNRSNGGSGKDTPRAEAREPVTMTLFGKRIFADIMKGKISLDYLGGLEIQGELAWKKKDGKTLTQCGRPRETGAETGTTLRGTEERREPPETAGGQGAPSRRAVGGRARPRWLLAPGLRESAFPLFSSL